MKSDKVRWIIFGVLALVAATIWIRNLNLFSDNSEYFQVKPKSVMASKYSESNFTKIDYQKPKLNPFILPKPAEPKKEIKQKTPVVKKQKNEPKRISGLYSIDGIVIESDNPQAILKNAKGTRSVLISMGDTLNGWQIRTIESEMIIFSQDTFRDTLLLLK